MWKKRRWNSIYSKRVEVCFLPCKTFAAFWRKFVLVIDINVPVNKIMVRLPISEQRRCRPGCAIAAPGPQIRVRNWFFFLFLNQNICCGYSKEPSQWDCSFEHSNTCLSWLIRKYSQFYAELILLTRHYESRSLVNAFVAKKVIYIIYSF